MFAGTQLDSIPVADQLVMIVQVGVAAVLGAIVGLERELAGKRAGIRTHMLVASASALATAIGVAVLGDAQGDATRVLHGVLTGVGFIGAGAIVQTKKVTAGPSGLTTASTVLLVAVVGATCGLGAPVVAVAVTMLAMLTLRGVKGVELAVRRRNERRRATMAASELAELDDSD